VNPILLGDGCMAGHRGQTGRGEHRPFARDCQILRWARPPRWNASPTSSPTTLAVGRWLRRPAIDMLPTSASEDPVRAHAAVRNVAAVWQCRPPSSSGILCGV
jgi:hypothetical protein